MRCRSARGTPQGAQAPRRHGKLVVHRYRGSIALGPPMSGTMCGSCASAASAQPGDLIDLPAAVSSPAEAQRRRHHAGPFIRGPTKVIFLPAAPPPEQLDPAAAALHPRPRPRWSRRAAGSPATAPRSSGPPATLAAAAPAASPPAIAARAAIAARPPSPPAPPSPWPPLRRRRPGRRCWRCRRRRLRPEPVEPLVATPSPPPPAGHPAAGPPRRSAPAPSPRSWSTPLLPDHRAPAEHRHQRGSPHQRGPRRAARPPGSASSRPRDPHSKPFS